MYLYIIPYTKYMILVTEGSQCGPDVSKYEHSAGHKSDPGKNLKPFFVEALPTYEVLNF